MIIIIKNLKIVKFQSIFKRDTNNSNTIWYIPMWSTGVYVYLFKIKNKICTKKILINWLI